MDINRGDRFDYLVSMSGPSRGLQDWAREHYPADAPQRAGEVRARRRQRQPDQDRARPDDLRQHDTNLPRPYSRIHLVQGTKGLFQGYPEPRLHRGPRPRRTSGSRRATYLAEFEHPLWKELAEQRRRAPATAAWTIIEDYRLIKCLREGMPTDMNVYDAAALSAVVDLSAAVERAAEQPPSTSRTSRAASGSRHHRWGSCAPEPEPRGGAGSGRIGDVHLAKLCRRGCVEINMLISTTAVLEGRPVSRYLGIVTGEAIIGANIFRDMFAAVRDVVGGRSATYEKALAEAREVALTEMQQRAQELGANAVIGVDLDYEVLGQSNGMLMVSCSGTAVVC